MYIFYEVFLKDFRIELLMKKMCCSLKHPPGRRSRYRDGKGEKVKRVNLSTRKMSNSFGEKEKKKKRTF